MCDSVKINIMHAGDVYKVFENLGGNLRPRKTQNIENSLYMLSVTFYIYKHIKT